MKPRSMPKLSSRTLATGARQLVVHEALETMLCAGVRIESLTPSTMIASTSSLGGTVRMTFFAPARRWGSSLARSRRTPVASITTSAPVAAHGRSAGSRWALSGMRRPATTSAPSPQAIGCSKIPITVS